MTADRQELARERTEWAEDRTVLANERTFAGWMRTGMGALGIAIGLQAVFGAMDPTWVAKSAASVFVVISLIMFVSAYRASVNMYKRLDAHTAEPVSRRHLSVITVLMCLGSVVSGAVLWMI